MSAQSSTDPADNAGNISRDASIVAPPLSSTIASDLIHPDATRLTTPLRHGIPSPTPKAPSPDMSAIFKEKLPNTWREIQFEKMKKESRTWCDSFIKKFVECEKGRTFSVVWMCRQENDSANVCIKNYMQHTQQPRLTDQQHAETTVQPLH